MCTLLLHHEREKTMNVISQSSAASGVLTHDLAGTTTRRRRIRVTAMLAATATASAIWLLSHAAGADFTMRASGQSITIGLADVIGLTLVFAGLGWAALALLERYSHSAAKNWARLAGGALLLSFVPVFAEHATAGTRTALVLIHLTVAAVLISALRYTTKDR
jgi:hypothetical protein